MKINLFFFSFIYSFLFIKSIDYFGGYITINTNNINSSIIDSWADNSTNHNSKTLDPGRCSCDLTSLCDYRCCCDPDCINNNNLSEWINKEICINKERDDFLDDFNCRTQKYKDKKKKNKTIKLKEEMFNYNSKKSKMLVKDHIYNIMCIEYNNAQDMGEFYLDEYEDNIQELEESWKLSFGLKGENGQRRLESNISYSYGKKIGNFHLYTSSADGTCKITDNIYYLKPFESSCNFNDTFTMNDFNNLNNTQFGNQAPITYGNNNISEITYILDYNKNNYIVEQTIKILQTNKNSNITKFKLIWNNTNLEKKLYKGYQQGKPLKIGFYESNDLKYYENGYFFGISDYSGYCVDSQLNDVLNIKTIYFKKNIIYACKVRTNYEDTHIYNRFCNKNFSIAQAPNSSGDEWQKFSVNCSILNKDEDFVINLLILTSKEGKESKPYEFVRYVQTKTYSKPSNSQNKTLTLSVKFVELTSSLFNNNKNNKITSSILSNGKFNFSIF